MGCGLGRHAVVLLLLVVDQAHGVAKQVFHFAQRVFVREGVLDVTLRRILAQLWKQWPHRVKSVERGQPFATRDSFKTHWTSMSGNFRKTL